MIKIENEHELMQIYDEFFPKIFNYIKRSIMHHETAEDLTAITFTKAVEFFIKKKRVIENFSPWIYKIATNEIRKYYKKKGKKKTVSIDDENTMLNQTLNDQKVKTQEDITNYIILEEALKTLEPEEALVIRLHFYERMSYAELREVLGIKEVTLRSKVHRILKKLSGSYRWENNE